MYSDSCQVYTRQTVYIFMYIINGFILTLFTFVFVYLFWKKLNINVKTITNFLFIINLFKD